MVMAMAAFSIIVCVFVLDLHHRNSNTPVPRWVRWMLLGRLSRCLGLYYELGSRHAGADRSRHSTNHRSSVIVNRAKTSKRRRATGKMFIDAPRSDLMELERRARRQNSVLANRRPSNGPVVSGSSASVGVAVVDDVRTESSDFNQRHMADLHDESCRDAATSPDNLTNGDGRHTALLLSAILTQLRYITADMRRQCKTAQVKDEWKLVAKVIDRLLLLVFIVVISVSTIAILCLYPTLSNVDTTFS